MVSVRSVLFLACCLASCLPDDAPVGLRRTPEGAGPRVVFDFEARPLPEIPFPNDLATRPDPTSPTGRRLNLSVIAPTEAERELRTLVLELDGFGTFAPITVSFDRPLDVAALDGRGRAPEDDPVVIVDVSEGEHFGERFLVDLGRGHFPLSLPRPDAYFDGDPRSDGSNLYVETRNEDKNGNGELDPGEDSDGDSVLDFQNTFGPDDDTDEGLVTFYERETNTLMIRTLLPLRENRTYAVVLTALLHDEAGQSVRSPFDFVHHLQQSEALGRLGDALAKHELNLDDIAFTWTFTTQSVTKDLVELRRGLDGYGPFAELAEQFPPELLRLDPMLDPTEDHPAILQGDKLNTAFSLIAPSFVSSDPVVLRAFIDSYKNVDFVVAGRFLSPYLMGDRTYDRGNPVPGYDDDDDEHFRVDRVSGALVVEPREVPFWCLIPKARPGLTAPFDVVFFAHGFGGTRMHSLAYAGSLARFGLATCAIDAFGHGFPITGGLREQLDLVLEVLKMTPFAQVLEGFRARDLTNDGVPDSAGDTFTTDALHTRDNVRQSALDWMRLIQIVKAFDGERPWNLPGALGTLAGDFDGDGKVDFGGPTAGLHFSGISYGGLMSGIVGGIEPGLTSVVPISGGGGLTDLALRSTQQGVPEATVLRAFGPLLVGERRAQGYTSLRFLLTDATRIAKLELGDIAEVPEGARVVLTNLRTGESGTAYADAQGTFRVTVATDAPSGPKLRRMFNLEPWRPDFQPHRLESTDGLGDGLLLQVFREGEDTPFVALDRFGVDMTFRGVVFPAGSPFVAPAQGWGLSRQTPRFRRFAQITQMIGEPADAINYARNHVLAPPAFSDGTPSPGANLLSIVTVGDTNVPVATGVSFALAAGIVTLEETETLIDEGVVMGLSRLEPLHDVDDLSDGQNGFDLPVRADPLRITRKAESGKTLALRLPVIEPEGAHGFAFPRPNRAFDVETYLVNLMGQFFTTGEATHRPCLVDSSCEDFPPPP